MRVLFVCHGNTCRSPAAEAVVRHLSSETGLALLIDSAGVSADRLGADPTPEMQDLAKAAGYNLVGLRARKVTKADFDDFDLMVGMDESVVAALKMDQPAESDAQILGFMSYVGPDGPDEIADPWHTKNYPAAFDLIQNAARAFVSSLAVDQPRQ